MKAIECTKYGSTEFLKIVEVKRPLPKENEVLIKIHATSVTSGDARIRRADPFIIRLIFGCLKPRKSVLGIIVSGEVESVGIAVKNFKRGDQVYGSTGMKFGAHAEYVIVNEDATLVTKPANMSYEEAAALPFGGTAALHFLRKANILQGQKVLIYGASGAIGSLAVQLAKHQGARVTAVCSASNSSLMKALGAEKVIDYKKEDFTKNGEKYDVIFDTVGKSSFKGAVKSLNKKGHLLMASAGMGLMLWSSIVNLFTTKKIVSGVIKETADDLHFMNQLYDCGRLKAVIDSTFPLEQIALGHDQVDTGHKKGNVIVRMNHSSN